MGQYYACRLGTVWRWVEKADSPELAFQTAFGVNFNGKIKELGINIDEIVALGPRKSEAQKFFAHVQKPNSTSQCPRCETSYLIHPNRTGLLTCPKDNCGNSVPANGKH